MFLLCKHKATDVYYNKLSEKQPTGLKKKLNLSFHKEGTFTFSSQYHSIKK